MRILRFRGLGADSTPNTAGKGKFQGVCGAAARLQERVAHLISSPPSPEAVTSAGGAWSGSDILANIMML